MSIFNDIEDSISGPFESFGNTFEKLFTDPSKLTAKEIPTLLFPIPGAGSAITYDIDHPEAAAYQAAVLAGVAGGAQALSVYGPSQFAFASDINTLAAQNAAAQAAQSGAAGAFYFGDGGASIAALEAAPAAAPASPAALIAADFGASAPVQTGLSLNAAAAGAAPTGAKAAAAAAVAGPSAVKSTISSFLQNVKDAGPIAATLALLQGDKAKTGAAVNGGSNPPTNAAGVPIAVPADRSVGATAPTLARLPGWLIGGALLGVGVWAYKHSKPKSKKK